MLSKVASSECSRDQPDIVEEFHLEKEEQCIAICQTYSPIADVGLVDHPTQLVFIWIFICWVGGGDPCGVAELCISGLWSQKKQARTDVFLKYPCHVHKDSPEAENGTKNFIKPTKNLFVSLNSQFVPISCSNFSGQIEFGLKSCSNQSGQIEFGLKCCCN